MRTFVCLFAAAVLTTAGCGRFTSSTSGGKEARASAGARLRNPAYNLVVGKPITHGNLTIFPVVSRTPKNDDRYITLDEGLKAGTVEVFEMGHEPGNAANAETVAQPPVNVEPSAEPIIEPPAPEIAVNPTADLDVEFTQGSFDSAIPQDHVVDNDRQSSGQGNDVNRLMVLNKSNRPLYLMPGEIILGGSQDRTIGRELVLAPNPKPVPVEVFCVEHGRWGQRGADETVGMLNRVAANSVSGQSVAVQLTASRVYPVADNVLPVLPAALEADRGKFIASVGQLSKSGRLAVQDAKSQQEVWDKVEIENSKAGVSNASDRFTENYVNEDAMKRLDPYIVGLQEKIAGQGQIVGVIVAINGKAESMDVFESTPLFRKLWPKLLKSYALDAANESPANKLKKDGKPIATYTCSHASAESFLCDAMSDKRDKSEAQGGLATSTRRSSRLTSFAVEAATIDSFEVGETALPAAAFDSDASESVHVSAFAH